MSKKEKSVAMVNESIEVFKCPICHSPVKVSGLKSIICSNNHTFHFAKQGYINMMTRPVNNHYDKNLFESRQKLVEDSDLYTLLHKKIAEMFKEFSDVNPPIVMVDAGCGDGSHLQKILEECNNDLITAVGLDVSKEGIAMATKNYSDSTCLVGDLANLPLTSYSCHVLLNIFSLANYTEFKRILDPDGLIVKVVPRANYLKELREGLFPNREPYNNSDIVSLFKQHFHLLKQERIRYTKKLNKNELRNLVQMSPIAWHANKKRLFTFINQGLSEITIDLDVLVGSHEHANGGWNVMENICSELENVEISFLDRFLFHIPRLAVHQFDRIGIVGKNGAGKSTLLKLIAGEITPDQGFVKQLIDFSYFDQLSSAKNEAIDFDLMGKLSIPETSSEHFSGGEHTRKKLAALFSNYHEGLLIDEPTTHLDQDGKNFFLDALTYYYGALVIVSHDRYVLDQLVTKIWEIEDGKITEYTGNYSDYVEQKEFAIQQQQEQHEKYLKERSRLMKAAKEKMKKASKVTQASKRVKKSEVKEKPNKMFMTKSKDTSQKL